jgi:hypothetical protein
MRPMCDTDCVYVCATFPCNGDVRGIEPVVVSLRHHMNMWTKRSCREGSYYNFQVKHRM